MDASSKACSTNEGGAKDFVYMAWSRFLTFFGDMRLFKWPLWLVYDPDFFKMPGRKTERLMELLEPGDVILRGYDSYLDSRFIKGDYSHAGVYVGGGRIVHAVAPKVEETTVIDFAQCDRVAVCRPSKLKDEAVAKARKFLEDQVPYDFWFKSKDPSALYCFELAARCYDGLDVKTFEVKKLFGLIRRQVYLSKSFKESSDFEVVFEYNPKRSVDYERE